ncbi:unnamed protein product [Brassica oleracea]|uniref:Uncharacterized protein n=1 Tax=Brassica oleracea TaxID=3712 RepID=A0A3P6B365_BRAOL|nr:unnamed protein product [Brassica oleracea]
MQLAGIGNRNYSVKPLIGETFENLLTIMNLKTSLLKGLKLCGCLNKT